MTLKPRVRRKGDHEQQEKTERREQEKFREKDNCFNDADEDTSGYEDSSLETKVSNSVGRGAVENVIKQTVYEKYHIDSKAMKEFSRFSPTEMLSGLGDSAKELSKVRADYMDGKISKDEMMAASSRIKGEISGKMLEIGSSRKSILEDVLALSVLHRLISHRFAPSAI